VAFSRAANPQIVPRLDGSGGFLKTLDTKTCRPPKCYLDCERDVVSWILEPLNPKDRETFESFSPVAGKHNNSH